MSMEKKILATVWLVSNKESFRGVADRFGMNKGRLHHVVVMVCQLITQRRADVIRWPSTEQQLQSYASKFQQRCGIPGVAGAIDGTHICIPGPSSHRESYINRKGLPSIQLQVVCTADLLFLDVYTGWPGAVHDARVFRNSPLKDVLEDATFPSEYHLLGDSAYPLSSYLLVPFRDNGQLSVVEKTFNKAHASTRVEVERAIGLLKGKFRRLKYLEMTDLGSIPVVIFATCSLHNFLILHGGVDEEDIEHDEADSGSPDADSRDCSRTASEKWLAIAHMLM